ncbi:putative MT1628-like inactive lipase [Actinomadura rubteroloni]|uniref:Putative MT1628-like inactive lipase n=1 Tax=Actinomadura rubteroloni TaxID=1926885 RepID=A0A2P4UN26_9ACTN|nr:lipase family protein [Actinomadura rubteroloni]POM26451.1 putative MT1628-like inactive lipase [Actinomadura rubteroloni]
MRTRRARLRPPVRVALALGAAGLLGGGAVAAVPADADTVPVPSADPFYRPPSPLPPGASGDIVRSRPAAYPLSSEVASTQVLYRTQNATGKHIAVSGTVLVPKTAWSGKGQRPLVSYAVGTRGLGDSCAPSYSLSRGLDYEQLAINDLLNKGWAVAVTDMEGLGTPGVHTYVVGRSEGRAVLDMARAAERLPGTGLNAATPVGILGYSQGGGSAGWAAQLAATYAPDLDLKGVSASGVISDMVAVGAFEEGGLFVGSALMAALGFDAAYPELKLDSYLNADGRRMKERYSGLCFVSVDLGPAAFDTAFRRFSDFTTRDLMHDPAWLARFAENKLGAVKPSVPVFQGHALFDEVLPLGQADAVHKDWCKLGANLTWKVYPLAEHLLGAVQSYPDASNFLNDRFQGKPVTGNC